MDNPIFANEKYSITAEMRLANKEVKKTVDSIFTFFAVRTVMAIGPPKKDTDDAIVAIDM